MSQIQSFLFDIEKFKNELTYVNSDEWINHSNTKAYDGSWFISSLTSTTSETKTIVANENQDYIDTPLLKKTKYLKDGIDTFRTKVEAVRFMNLKTGSIIKKHCDKGFSSCLIEHYENGCQMGVPLMEWMNLSYSKKRATEENTEPFPVVYQWLKK
jgi:hypothetical protein